MLFRLFMYFLNSKDGSLALYGPGLHFSSNSVIRMLELSLATNYFKNAYIYLFLQERIV